ncbi:MAG: nucleotidyltransferase substrate binding protein [Firmicutes bacterium]|nr:nucleotidyltransferase substrate binding protein [Bacillota bacterium]
MQDIRWKQRFENFEKAYNLLNNAMQRVMQQPNDDLLEEGLVQRFEYTFELLWKTFKDILEQSNVQMEFVSPKNVIRECAKSGLLEKIGIDGEIFLDMLEKRNLLAHTYNVNNFEIAVNNIKNIYFEQTTIAYKYLLERAKSE